MAAHVPLGAGWLSWSRRGSCGPRTATGSWWADRLALAFSEGRIREVEYAERLDAAFQASTYRELSVLTADLPSACRADSRRWLARGDRPGPRGRRMPGVLVTLWTL